MISRITPLELEELECIYTPVCMIECLFTDLDNDNLAAFDPKKFSEVRLAQLSLLSYEYPIDYDNLNLSIKEKFKQREGSGNVFCYGGRNFGKTLCVEKLDLILDMILMDGDNIGFSSYDAIHIEGVLEPVIQAFENHPFLKLFEPRIKRNPYLIYLRKNRSRVLGVNMNLQGENPGGQFFQKHFTKLYIEEGSFEPQEVYQKRLDSVSENGCVYRFSGMTDFTKYSPPGKIYYDPKNISWIINYPQYVNPRFDAKTKEKAIKEHGGEQSIPYRMYVKGEIVEDLVSAMDMERVRKNYNDKKVIKNFEITKENYKDFTSFLIIEKPNNCECLYLCADIGETAATEIIVISQLNNSYHYLYNITVYNLTDKEQFNIFKHCAYLLGANIIALDCTEGLGRAIFRSLAEIFPKENLVWVGFNEKIPIEPSRDEYNNMLFKDGKIVYKEELVDSWSVKRLRDLLYEKGKVEIPLDYKLDSQLNSLIAVQSGNRTLYQCAGKTNEDHLFAAWRVFAIAEWMNYMTLINPIIQKKFSKIGF